MVVCIRADTSVWELILYATVIRQPSWQRFAATRCAALSLTAAWLFYRRHGHQFPLMDELLSPFHPSAPNRVSTCSLYAFLPSLHWGDHVRQSTHLFAWFFKSPKHPYGLLLMWCWYKLSGEFNCCVIFALQPMLHTTACPFFPGFVKRLSPIHASECAWLRFVTNLKYF
jgi:hypothetical protein